MPTSENSVKRKFNFLEFTFQALEQIGLRKDSVRSLRALGFLAPLDASSVLPHRFGRLCPVAHPQHLVDGAQVLLDRRLRQVQAARYLGVAQALDYQFQDLSLTGREVPYFGVLLLAQEEVP